MDNISHSTMANQAKINVNDKNKLYRNMANAIRALSMDAVEKAKSGHPGMPMGMADVVTILFAEFLKFNPMQSNWPDRDRFLLSAGHGSMLHYALLYLTGYPDITLEDIKNFRQLNAKTAGHPELGFLQGIETTTGPLGQGLANAVGMCIAEEILATKFKDIVDHKTYAVVGDGCLMEGISQEAISLAGHLSLKNLVVIFDDNSITIDGPTSLSTSENHIERFKACGWNTIAIDGHDFNQIREALIFAKNTDKPVLIACKTIIAYGAPNKAGSEKSHGSPLGTDEIAGARLNLDWRYDAFEIPAELLEEWREVGRKNNDIYSKWLAKLNSLPKDVQHEFARLQNNKLPEGWQDKIVSAKKQVSNQNICEATRKSSGRAIEALAEIIPELVGGSADLTGSNDTKTSKLLAITKDNFAGRYIYYGIREHAMAAIMNGLALHKGIIPYGGTFLVFSDYCRPAIRLSAIMKLQVIYIMTHDSIGLGEDGPTHQPIEHLASLRAMPDLLVFRPADAVETLECWQLALEHNNEPSLLALSRQDLPLIRKDVTTKNLCTKGAYIIAEAEHIFSVTIFATGSEVKIALEVKTLLEQQKIGARIISMPCWELFARTDEYYQSNLLDNDSLKVAIEAAGSMGWEKFIGRGGLFIGMNGFGASAKAEDLYQHFGITVEHIFQKIMIRLGK
jgi:transketolase